MVFGDFRITPLPEQGASQQILSKMFSPWILLASWFVIIMFVKPLLSRLILSGPSLLKSSSLATRIPWSCIKSAIWVVFDPGEEHMSRILKFFGIFFGISRSSGGVIEVASWT